jgi:hypothetical protein
MPHLPPIKLYPYKLTIAYPKKQANDYSQIPIYKIFHLIFKIIVTMLRLIVKYDIFNYKV